MSKRKGKKLFCQYAFQVINHTDKKITYADKVSRPPSDKDVLVLPIAMRKIIDQSLKGYQILTQ